jgi:Origin of replication binding protein
VIDSDKMYYDCHLVKRAVSEYDYGDNFFHDCGEEGVTNEDGIPAGIPSAFLLKGSREGTPIVYCFACQQVHFILSVHIPELYECKITQDLIEGQKIVLHHMTFVNKVTVLDAPCGSGKTYNIRELICNEHTADWKVCVPTYRRSLAIALGSEFKIQIYTQINSVLDPTSAWKRVCICANSLERIPEELLTEYDIVVLDEAGALRRHFVSELMSQLWMRVLERLRIIVDSARTIIISQYRLTERDVEFFVSMKRGYSLYDDRIVSIKFQYPGRQPRKLLYSKDIDMVYFRLMQYLKTNGNMKRVVVMFTSVSSCEQFYSYLCGKISSNEM